MAAARAASRLLKASCLRCEREQPRVDQPHVRGWHASPTRAILADCMCAPCVARDEGEGTVAHGCVPMICTCFGAQKPEAFCELQICCAGFIFADTCGRPLHGAAPPSHLPLTAQQASRRRTTQRDARRCAHDGARTTARALHKNASRCPPLATPCQEARRSTCSRFTVGYIAFTERLGATSDSSPP